MFFPIGKQQHFAYVMCTGSRRSMGRGKFKSSWKYDGRRFCSKVVAGVEYRGLHRGNLQKEIAHSLGSRIGW